MICMNEEFKNAWHNVRGISSEEMKQAALEAERLYGDIIHLKVGLMLKQTVRYQA